jgi:hypothetical protein
MSSYPKLFLAAFLAAIFSLDAGPASAQGRTAGDTDDQFVISGCVMRSQDARTAEPHSMMVWSKGDVYLSAPSARVKPSETARPIGTAGAPGTTFYWLDDEDDFAKYAGQRVEIVGELSDEIDHGEASARIPTSWFGPAARGKDLEADIVFRAVDVEKVSPLGPCTGR